MLDIIAADKLLLQALFPQGTAQLPKFTASRDVCIKLFGRSAREEVWLKEQVKVMPGSLEKVDGVWRAGPGWKSFHDPVQSRLDYLRKAYGKAEKEHKILPGWTAWKDIVSSTTRKLLRANVPWFFAYRRLLTTSSSNIPELPPQSSSPHRHDAPEAKHPPSFAINKRKMETLNIDSDSSGYETDREASEAPILASADDVKSVLDLSFTEDSRRKRSREPSDGPPAAKRKRSVLGGVKAETYVARPSLRRASSRDMPGNSNGGQSSKQPIVVSDSSDLEAIQDTSEEDTSDDSGDEDRGVGSHFVSLRGNSVSVTSDELGSDDEESRAPDNASLSAGPPMHAPAAEGARSQLDPAAVARQQRIYRIALSDLRRYRQLPLPTIPDQSGLTKNCKATRILYCHYVLAKNGFASNLLAGQAIKQPKHNRKVPGGDIGSSVEGRLKMVRQVVQAASGHVISRGICPPRHRPWRLTKGGGSRLIQISVRSRMSTIQDFTAEFDRLFLAEYGDDVEDIISKLRQ